VATMNTQPMPPSRPRDTIPAAAAPQQPRSPEASTPDPTAAADAALAELFPSLRLRQRETPPSNTGER
jgi:hypothetical protein